MREIIDFINANARVPRVKRDGLMEWRDSSDITKDMQTLLLADDSVTIQRVIELTFADEGHQRGCRQRRRPGDRAARFNAAGIVLVDVGMPGKSGYDVAGYVKHNPHLAHIPVVLLTGAFEPVDEARATALGATASSRSRSSRRW